MRAASRVGSTRAQARHGDALEHQAEIIRIIRNREFRTEIIRFPMKHGVQHILLEAFVVSASPRGC